MAPTRFHLAARVSSDTPKAITSIIESVLPKGSVRREGDEFIVDADFEGDDPKKMNRDLLSALRRAEKRTRMRSQWTSEDGTTYKFFDYVLKQSKKGSP